MDLLALIIAVVMGTPGIIALVRQIKADKKEVSLILKHEVFTNRLTVTLFNQKARPVKITGVVIESVYKEKKGKYHSGIAPQNALFMDFDTLQDFPFALNQVDHKTITFTGFFLGAFTSDSETFIITFTDLENNKYQVSKAYVINDKFGGSMEVENKFNSSGAKKFVRN